MTTHLEADLADWFRKRVQAVGGMVIQLTPTVRGVPDRLVLLPPGHMHLVELKTVTGARRPGQVAWHERVAAIGIKVVTLHGRDEVRTWLAAQLDESGGFHPDRPLRPRARRAAVD